MEKKRILLIADSDMSNSGVPMVYMSIVRALKDDFIFDIVVSSTKDMHYKEEFLSHGGNIYYFEKKIPNNSMFKMLWMIFCLGKLIKKFCKENLLLNNYYALHSFDEKYSSCFFRIAKAQSIKYRIIHICAAFRAYKRKFNIKQFLFEFDRRKTLRHCTSIACSSDSTLELNNYKNKGVVLYRTYNKKQFPGVVECNHDKLVLTQIGTFSSRKNQLFSLEVVKNIKQKINNVTINFVGKEMEEKYLNKMNEFINDNNLKNNVNYLGTSPDRNALSKETSFVLHPSIMEGSGNVLVESQVSGIHCFASNTLPRGYDLGNVQYLELNAALWSNKILSYFKENKNIRKKPIGCEKFSEKSFKKTLLEMMSLQ